MNPGVKKQLLPWVVQAWIAVGLVLFYSSFLAASRQSLYPVANQIGPGLLMATCLMNAYCVVRLQPLAVWSPLPWFLAVYALYYGFGPLSYLYGSEESIAFMDAYYPVEASDLLHANMLNSVALLCVCAGVLCWQAGIGSGKAQESSGLRRGSDRYVRQVVVVFLAIGLPVKYALSLPYQLGLYEFIVPGTVAFLSKLVGLALLILIGYYGVLPRAYRVLTHVLLVSELLTAAMTFSKLEILTTVLMIVLGFYLKHSRMRTIVMGAIAICSIYAVLVPFILFARAAYDPHGVSSMADLAASAGEYRGLEEHDLDTLLAGAQIWWTRLSYANAQAFAIQSFDSGAAGDSLTMAVYALVPRALYPDKPMMSLGDKFTELVTGKEATSFSAAGIFGEAYWNGGWMPLVVMGICVGMALAGMGAFSMRAIGEGELAYLPVVFIGLLMGLRPDDWFVLVYVGGLVQAAVLYVSIRCLSPFLSAERRLC